MTALEDLRRADEVIGALIAEIGLTQWYDSTPCALWSVRDVVDHLVGMNRVFVSMLDGGPMPQRGDDALGGDPVGAFLASSAALEAAFSRPGVMDRVFLSPMGDASGADRLRIRLSDLLAHGWDLAHATGIELEIPEELAGRALAFTTIQMATQDRAGRFDEPQLVDADAPAIDRLAAFLGRTVDPNPA